jgi:excinuclease ABC subunit C
VLRRRFKRAAEASGEDVSAVVQDPRRNPEGDFGSDIEDLLAPVANQPRVDDRRQITDDSASESSIVHRPSSIVEEAAAKEQSPDDTWTELPDLILIDGGVGQLNGALEVLRELRFDHLPTAGVVKGPNRDRFDLLLPGASELIVLRRDSAALRLIQTIDEEADRFAKHYHRGLRAKSAVKSTLDDIPGIGPKRRRALIKAFGSLDGIRAASLEELAAVPGMTKKSAEEIKGLL